jgi:hypothetical protein
MIDDFIKELFKKPMIPVFVDVRDRRFTRSFFATKVIYIASYRHESIADVSARSCIAQVAKALLPSASMNRCLCAMFVRFEFICYFLNFSAGNS